MDACQIWRLMAHARSLSLSLSLSLCIPDGVVSVEKQSWFYSGELPWQENDDRTDAIVT